MPIYQIEGMSNLRQMSVCQILRHMCYIITGVNVSVVFDVRAS